METIWSILGLERTWDEAAIRRAYAECARACSPEEDQAGFLRIRQAYQAALAYAREAGEAHSEEGLRNESRNEPQGIWTIPEEVPEAEANPYRDREAIGRFRVLYTGPQRNNPKQWLEYFTSEAFLDAGWDRRFTALMLEEAAQVERELPPPPAFQLWLTVAYRFTVEAAGGERRVRLHPGADFPGMESILALAAKGPVPKKPRYNELAIQNSFQDRRHLECLAESGVWNSQALEEFKWIMGRYIPAYIKDRCEQRVAPDCERHPAGLRVFLHFFRRPGLPEQLYRMAWERFDLKNAVMGRGKALYGPLRALVIERVPGIAEEDRENFFQLNLERDACFARIQAAPEREEEELEALFAQENLQRALRSRRFVEEQLVYYFNWMNSRAPEGCIRRLGAFYQEHQDIPGWERVAEQAQRELARREAERAAEQEVPLPEEPDVSLVMDVLNVVRCQPWVGLERAYWRLVEPENTDWDEEEEEGFLMPPLGLFEEGDRNKPLTQEDLTALLEQYAAGEVERLELELCGKLLVLVRDGTQYGCFCFETGFDTWYALLSQPEVYTTVDSKEIKSYPFGLGMLQSYNIHPDTNLIMSQLNLVFCQLIQGRPMTRAGNVWLWASHTSQFNGPFKKRMAMQKFAKLPWERTRVYVLSKFVVSKPPVQLECVTLAGERTVTRIQPGSSGLAAGALVQYFQEKLAKLRLSWELDCPEGRIQRHLVLLKEGKQYMLAWLQDDKEQAGFYASDVPRVFQGKIYPACLVHQELGRIRSCVDMLVDDITCTHLVTDRPGEFVLEARPYAQVRAELVGGEG